ncbi:manganese-dependent inorganic pyrophosphatase [Fundicoccus culcitae]|uniref:Manganese-dependent inorganic pyrophosphatase n=1 Tax=Fundicoccus culcitae TaxID=2969821 RepID=A0ABY5P7T0_9LACT|nr:manganese-dependent inorganic pyrophosphatase [Fundicoccus culcitae]UUX34440.1 manganese-dependent inorganic pyrophosphatase [Fundicoccus culcitae]
MSKILVFGHKNPDTDTIASAIALDYYLEKLGYDSESVALGNPNEETAFALNYFNISAPRVIETASNEVTQVALVDHNEPQQSVNDIESLEVLYVVDHHRINGFNTAQPLYYRAEPIGSTASVLYKMFQEKDFDIPSAIAGMMLSAIISDTLLLKSPTTTREDEMIAYELAKIADVNIDAYGLKLLKAGTNIASKSAKELLASDSKVFEMHEHPVQIAQINTVDFVDVSSRKEELLEEISKTLKDSDVELFVVLVTDILENNSFAYVIGQNLEVVEKAFEQKVVDNEIQLPGVVSRKKQVVPQLTDAYSK